MFQLCSQKAETMTDYTLAATPFKVISVCTYGLLLALLALGGRPVLTAWTCVFCDITMSLTRHFKLLYAESLPDDGLRPRNQTMQEFFGFFFFLFSKCIICNFSRQRKKIWHCVSTHGALTGGLRPDQHIFALLARFGSLGLHPPSSLKQKSTWRSIVLSQRSRAKAHVQAVKTELPSSDLKRVSSIVILLFTCVVLSSLLRLLSILCFSSLLS